MKIKRNNTPGAMGRNLASAAWFAARMCHLAAARLIGLFGDFVGYLLRRISPAIFLALGGAVLVVPMVYLSAYRIDLIVALGQLGGHHLKTLAEAAFVPAFDSLCVVAGIVGTIALVAVAVSPFRHRLSLTIMKVAGAGFVVVWFYLLVFLYRAPNLLYEADKDAFANFQRINFIIRAFLLWLPGALAGMLYLLPLLTRTVHEHYRVRVDKAKLLGDRLVGEFKNGGGDWQFRSSTYWSGFWHVFVLFILPFLVFRGCREAPYGLPKGSGNPVVEVVRVKPVEEKKERQFVLNMNSPIIFYRPKIEDSEVFEKILQDTEATYVAQNLESGKLGQGGGDKGGWPHGMEGARVRFIRLEYAGGNWDLSMGAGADFNLLIQFNRLTGFDVASQTESRPVEQLRRFPKGKAPPFVYLTGSGNIHLTAREIRILRWYCLEEGGMIFADNGGGNFNRSFRNTMQRVFPEKSWIDIANDDIIYRQPFLFPNGAPPIWHHSGMRALGLKHDGRWIAFYHQGHIGDAWKTGNAGVSEQLAQAAYMMGINVVNYAFNRYHERHYD